MPFGVIEPWHLVLILIIALVVFGPGKLGDVGGALGRGIREFKTSMTIEEEGAKKDEKAPEAAKKPEVSEKAS